MKKTILFLMLAAAAPLAVQASESNGIGYSYVELGYVYDDATDSEFLSPKGLMLKGSYGFTDSIFAFGSYGRQKVDHWKGHNSGDEWSLGLGHNTSIGNRADWVTTAAFVRVDLNLHLAQFGIDGSIQEHDTGWQLATGVQGRITDKLVSHAYLGYQDVRHTGGGSLYGDFGLTYSLSKRWGISTNLVVEDGNNQYGAGLRARF